MCLAALQNPINGLREPLAERIQTVKAAGIALFNGTLLSIRDLGSTTKNASACDYLIRLGTELLKLIDLKSKVDRVARPMMATLETTRGFFDAARIFNSFKYVSSGDFLKDVRARNALPLITEVALFVGRLITTLQWCVKQKMADLDAWAVKAYAVGGKYGYAAVQAVKGNRLMDSAFVVGLCGLMVQDVRAIQKNEKVVSHTFSIVSLAADTFAIGLGLVNLASLDTLAALGILAAGTGLASWLADPENIQENRKQKSA